MARYLDLYNNGDGLIDFHDSSFPLHYSLEIVGG
jgi:hypothetical protein